MGIAGNTLDLIRSVFRRDSIMAGSTSSPVRYGQGQSRLGGYGDQLGLGPQTGSDFGSYMTDQVRVDTDLMSRYADYEDMDDYPELSSALDLYADDATQPDVITGKTIWAESDDEVIQRILNETLTENLRSEDDIWELARNLCKYGNDFEELVVMDEVGVVKLNNLETPATRRIEDANGILYGFIYDPGMAFRMDTNQFFEMLKNRDGKKPEELHANSAYNQMAVFEPWEVAHFRMRGKNRKDLYGVSVLEAARWVWKRLSMMEDAMVLYKLTRSPQRYAFYVDVGDVPPNEARAQVNKVKNDFKKTKFVDPRTGKINFRYNPLSMDEDIFIPVRKGKKATEIDVLAGPEGQQTEDVEYLRDKLFAALKIPKSYLGADETIGRANLSQQDVRFARTVMRIQRAIRSGYAHICRVDLAARNIDPDMVKFDIKMVVPSGALELAQIEVQKAKLDLSASYRGENFSEYFIWSRILGLSDEEIKAIQLQRRNEQGGGSSFELLQPEPSEADGVDVDQWVDNEEEKITAKQQLVAQKVLEEIQRGNTEFGKKMKVLKGLVTELKWAVHSNRNTRRK